MRSWPSWLAVSLGVLFTIFAFWHYHATADVQFLIAFLIPGAILIASGLMSLQMSYDAWCDYCMDCDCEHCGDCRDGDCCGKCECVDEPASHPSEP